jgi:hypothetical protein
LEKTRRARGVVEQMLKLRAERCLGLAASDSENDVAQFS